MISKPISNRLSAGGTIAKSKAKTKDQLAKRLIKALGMSREDASEIAGFVEQHFEGKAEVEDADLDPHSRSIFYTLEAKRILTFRREEYKNETGALRRRFFWRLRPEA